MNVDVALAVAVDLALAVAIDVVVDDRPVWSVVCFFVARAWRGRGMARVVLVS